MKQRRVYYDDYWQKPSAGWSPRNQHPDPILRSLLIKMIRDGNYVLDYGCGDCSKCGSLVHSLGAHYVGVDISLSAIQTCVKWDRILCGDENTPLPFTSEKFDVVLCIEVLEHLFRPDLALQQIYRVLKPGGVLIASVPNIAWIGNRLLMAAGFFNPGGSPETSFRAPWKDPHIRFFTKRALLGLVKYEMGMDVIFCTGSNFSMADLPLFYKAGKLRSLTRRIEIPLKSLGQIMPSLFAGNLFIVARKIP
ncbi:MAG: class I SAM-dependent methyltransferase [Roseiflexus sp.]|jgi:SAM-dependent methyltransferase|nr:class I SAM-dependent methyltransferase [Chloroflexus sp.]MBO9335495.1 class I SAM-dependent methyltransferase [Roseiflexus sp.]MBO9383170.1 class I SAM-dependent methyltransferase [Roseiflexus sp.]